MMNSMTNTNKLPPVTKEQRAAAIAEIAERKRAQEAGETPRPLVPGSRPVPPGSRAARVDEATRPGVVTPSKSERPVKIPAAANLVKPRVDDTTTATEGDIRERTAKAGADAELDAAVKPTTKKKPSDPNLLSVGDVARELGVDPKRARAKLRASGASAVEGRWPKVRRDSDEHKALIATLSATPSTT